MEKKESRFTLRRLGMILCGLAGAVALLASVGFTGAGLVRAQRAAKAKQLLEERYGESFTVDRVYGHSTGIGFDLWPFILMDDYFTAAAHSDAYPEMYVRADVDIWDDRMLDNYAAQRISRNTEAYLMQEILAPVLADGKSFFNVGISDAVGYGRPLEETEGLAADAGEDEDGASSRRFRAMTGLALHELEAEAMYPSATVFYSPASGHADTEELFRAADRILDYFISCAPEEPGAVTIYLITKPSGVERVRTYLTGNRIRNYSTLEYYAAMEPAVSASVKYDPKEKTRTPREEFVFQPLYPEMRGETVIPD